MVFLILISVFTFLWIFMKIVENRKIPPGPYGYPLLGYFPHLSKNTREAFENLRRKYGDIFSVKIGINRYIIINDFDVAKEILSNPAAYGRPQSAQQVLPGGGGFAFTSGKEWLDQRRFCVLAIKNLGMGKMYWRDIIYEETNELIETLTSAEGMPVDYMSLIDCSLAVTNFSFLTGIKLPKDKNDVDFKALMNFMDTILPELSPASLAPNLPHFVLKIMKKFFSFGSLGNFLQCLKDFEDLLKKKVRQVQASDTKHKSNFTSFYLEELCNQENNDISHSFTIDHLVGNITSLFVAGHDTNLASLNWFFLLMAANLDVQEKIHQEIDRVIGKDRRIYWEDHKNCPYIMAAFYEMERFISVVPVFPPRENNSPIEINGYIIPKGCSIIINMWSILRNPRYFEDPIEFKPERFLTSENEIKKSKYFIPFSTGKRNCPGENIAKITIFLYFTAIMQKCRISCPEGKSVKFVEKHYGAVRHPIPQELCFSRR